MVFPVPEGAETTKSRPRATSADPESRTTDPGCDLPHSTFCTCSRIFSSSALSATTTSETAGPSAFEPDRVHFTVHFLKKKVQLAPARLRRVGQRPPVLEMAAKPDHFFGDVRSADELGDLLRDRRLIGERIRAQLTHALLQPRLQAGHPRLGGGAARSNRSPSRARRASRSARRYPPSRTRMASSSSSAAADRFFHPAATCSTVLLRLLARSRIDSACGKRSRSPGVIAPVT